MLHDYKKVKDMKYDIKYIIDCFRVGEGRTQKLKRNVMWSFLIKIFSMAIEFVKVPIILSYLDNEVYGVWLTIVSIVMWTHNFDMGLSQGFRFKMTRGIALGDNDMCKKLTSTAYISMAAIMFLVFIIAFPISFFVNWQSVLNVTSIKNTELFASVIIVFAIFLMQFVCELISTVLKADQRAALSDVFKPIASVLSLCCILLLGTFSSNSLLYASVAMSAPYILVLLAANVFYYCKNYKEYSPSFEYFDRHYIKEIYSMGLKFFVGQLAGLVVFSSAGILLSNLINPTEVSVYNTARTYFGLVIIFSTIAREPFKAAITDAFVKNELKWINTSMNKMHLISLFFSIAALFMFLVSDFAIDIWTRGRIEVSWGLGIALTCYTIANVITAPYSNFLAGVGKLNIAMYVGLFKIISFIPVAIFFIKSWGTLGLVVAIILINTFPNFILGYLQFNRIMSGKATGIWNK